MLTLCHSRLSRRPFYICVTCRSVAEHFLSSVNLADEVKAGVVDVCVDMQERVSHMSKDFFQTLNRHYYVTPTSYLELIGTFKSILSQKREEITSQRDRYKNGLTKLMDTEVQVKSMIRIQTYSYDLSTVIVLFAVDKPRLVGRKLGMR